MVKKVNDRLGRYHNIGKVLTEEVFGGFTQYVIDFGEEGIQRIKSDEVEIIKPFEDKLYDGNYLISSSEKILVDEKNIYSSGFPIGNVELIPAKQNLKPSILWVDRNKSEEEKLAEIFSGKEKSDFTLNSFLDSRN